MARTQAADYEARRAAIVEKAARLFAQRGFASASISDLSRLCRMSKSLVYHYYSSKEDILFDVMHSHVAALLTAAEGIKEEPLEPRAMLRALTGEFMRLYVGASARQKVLLNEMGSLPADRRALIVGVQRRLIEIVREILIDIRPDLARKVTQQKPAAMLYFGMINWTHTWMRASGAVKPRAIAELACNIFLQGFEKFDLSS